MAFQPLEDNEDLLQAKEEEDHMLQKKVLHNVDNGKESLKDSSVLEEEHVDMHEVVPYPIHITATEQKDSDEETFRDDLEMFCSSLDMKQSTPLSDDHELQQKQVENHTIPVTLKEVVYEHYKKDVEINYSQKEEV